LQFIIICKFMEIVSWLINKEIGDVLRKLNSCQIMIGNYFPFEHIFFRMILRTKEWIIFCFDWCNVSKSSIVCWISSSLEHLVQLRIFNISFIYNATLVIIKNSIWIFSEFNHFVSHIFVKFRFWFVTNLNCSSHVSFIDNSG